jgi:hypothetical protein
MCDTTLVLIILRVHSSIVTKDKNFTSEEGGEGLEVTVPGWPKARAVTFGMAIYLRFLLVFFCSVNRLALMVKPLESLFSWINFCLRLILDRIKSLVH